jgi:hypothetical protein
MIRNSAKAQEVRSVTRTSRPAAPHREPVHRTAAQTGGEPRPRRTGVALADRVPFQGLLRAGRHARPTAAAAFAAIKTALVFAATHDLAASLEKEAQLQADLGRPGDHQAATSGFRRTERPSFEGR